MPTATKMLLLTSPRESGWLDSNDSIPTQMRAFRDRINESDDIEMYMSDVSQLDFVITNKAVAIFDRRNKLDLKEYSVIHLRNPSLFEDYAQAILCYSEANNIEVIDASSNHAPLHGKLSQMVAYALNDIPTPNTWSAWNIEDLHGIIRESGIRYPIIVKANNGIKGRDNFLVTSNEEFLGLKNTYNNSIQFVAQEYIVNDGDIRVLQFGDAIKPLVFKRIALNGSHLNNTSQGGSSELVDVDSFDSDALLIAERARRVLHRDFAGTDLIQDANTKAWYVLEVNENPALTTGDFIDQKLIKYNHYIKEKTT